MDVFRVVGERECESTGFNAIVFELTGNELPKNFKYKPKKKLITKEQIKEARDATTLEEALELLGFDV